MKMDPQIQNELTIKKIMLKSDYKGKDGGRVEKIERVQIYKSENKSTCQI
jgi:hypothetical protein